VLLNNHKGGLVQVPTDFDELAGQVILADLNGDGNLDLGISSIVYLGNGKGEFQEKSSLSSPMYGPNMVADVNGDGIPDIAIQGMGTIVLFLGLGDGTYATPFYLGVGPTAEDLFPANLHGQQASAGLPDLEPDGTGGVMVLINTTKP
jgi:hypothetical protein